MKLDAAALKRLAPAAVMVLLAGPIFLFMAADLIIFMVITRGRPAASAEVVNLSMEIVVCIFTGLVASYGIRSIMRTLKE
ncbi:MULTISPECIES: hypothetical protein [Phenylobacterium]|uniref:Uncharacterized protein n=1 Tax=Phenylobacterium koreense TaxID=266125 RepID=A0ABV2EMR4_9CAUL